MDSLPTRPKILVVEDEQIVALDAEASLDALGYETVGIAVTGTEALQLIAERCPDLVLMDIQLPGSIDGITAADEIRRRWQIPVVFVTAYASAEVLARAKTAGAYGYVTKPFKAKDLNATVEIALQQHRLTREIFQEHGWLRTVLAGMSDGVIATDTGGNVKFMNLVAEELTGWTQVEAMGKRIEEVYPLRTEDGVVVEQCQLRRVLATNQPISRQRFLLVNRSARTWVVEDSAAPIHDAHGKLAGAVTVIVDITERQKAEQQRQRLFVELERSNEDLSRFSYALAHDLQSPARSVHALAELLARGREGELNDGQLRLLAMITQSARGMERLVSSMLEFAQFGHGETKPERIRVNEVIETVQLRLSAAIADSRATIQCGSLPVMEADRTQIEQVFQNLVANAIQYRRPGEAPIISISGENVEGGWRFAVRDNGEGIPLEWQQRIFEPLKRLHGTEVPGSGLGLALCRRIVERHGGRIWAESAGAGQGATIRFTISKLAASDAEQSRE